MRILDINNFYSPTGGGVRTYHDRKLDWVKQHPEHTAALVVPSTRFHREKYGNTVRYEVPAIPLGRSGYRLIVTAGGLEKVIDDFKPELIEVGSVYVLPPLLKRALKGRSIPTVGFYHADYPDTYVQPLARRLPDLVAGGLPEQARRHCGAAYSAMTATFGASDHVLSKLFQYGVRRLFKTPLGVDTSVFRPDARRADFRTGLGILSDQVLISFVGRLAPEKGVELLVAAWPHVSDRERFVLLVAGHGPMADRIEVLAMSEPSVRRLPFLRSPGEVATLMASSDAVVLPGAFETFSLTALEALACGTSVIAPDSGGAGELVKLAGGSPFAAGDARALGAAMAAVTPRDSARSAVIRTRIERNYTWDAAFTRQFGYYQQVARAFYAGDLNSLLPGQTRWHSAVDV